MKKILSILIVILFSLQTIAQTKSYQKANAKQNPQNSINHTKSNASYPGGDFGGTKPKTNNIRNTVTPEGNFGGRQPKTNNPKNTVTPEQNFGGKKK